MNTLISHNYFALFLGLSVGTICLILFGLFFTWVCLPEKKKAAASPAANTSEKTSQPAASISNNDFSAIAGDDLITTQLDLARACIEADRKSLAKKILTLVMEQGTTAQREEAHRLLGFL